MIENMIDQPFVELVKSGKSKKRADDDEGIKRTKVRALDPLSGQWNEAHITQVTGPFQMVINWKSVQVPFTNFTVKNSPCCRKTPLDWPIQPREIPLELQPKLTNRNLPSSDSNLNYLKVGRCKGDIVYYEDDKMPGTLQSGYVVYNNQFLEYVKTSDVDEADNADMCEHYLKLVHVQYTQLRRDPSTLPSEQPAKKRKLRHTTESVPEDYAMRTGVDHEAEVVVNQGIVTPVVTTGVRREEGRREILAKLISTWGSDVPIPPVNPTVTVPWSIMGVPLLTVPCVNGWLLCGDNVLYRNVAEEYSVAALYYKEGDVFAVLSAIEEEEDHTTIHVRAVTLNLVDTSKMTRKAEAKTPVIPGAGHITSQVFWAYVNLKRNLVNYVPKKDQARPVLGTFVKYICQDTDYFRGAFGVPLRTKTARVEYAATPNATQKSSSSLDNILGKEWDRLSKNSVLYRLRISAAQIGLLRLLKMTAYIQMCASFIGRTDYRIHVSTFVHNSGESDVEDDEEEDFDD